MGRVWCQEVAGYGIPRGSASHIAARSGIVRAAPRRAALQIRCSADVAQARGACTVQCTGECQGPRPEYRACVIYLLAAAAEATFTPRPAPQRPAHFVVASQRQILPSVVVVEE